MNFRAWTKPFHVLFRLHRTNTLPNNRQQPEYPFALHFQLSSCLIWPSSPVHTQAHRGFTQLTVRLPALRPDAFHDFISPLLLISFQLLLVLWSWALSSLTLQRRPRPVHAPVPPSALKHIQDKVVPIKTRRPPLCTCTSPLFSPPHPFIKRLIF